MQLQSNCKRVIPICWVQRGRAHGRIGKKRCMSRGAPSVALSRCLTVTSVREGRVGPSWSLALPACLPACLTISLHHPLPPFPHRQHLAIVSHHTVYHPAHTLQSSLSTDTSLRTPHPAHRTFPWHTTRRWAPPRKEHRIHSSTANRSDQQRLPASQTQKLSSSSLSSPVAPAHTVTFPHAHRQKGRLGRTMLLRDGSGGSRAGSVVWQMGMTKSPPIPL